MRPMPGFALIELETPITESEGIVIPEAYRKRITRIGKVIATNPGFPHKCNDCGFVQTSGRSCNKCHGNVRITRATPVQADPIENRRVTIDPNAALSPITSTLIVVANDAITGILEDDATVGKFSSDSGIHRCTFCGPAMPGASLGVMLVQDATGWYCPVCHKYEDGSTHKIPASVLR